MADNARAKRLADLIREVVAQKLLRGIKDPRLGSNVTITDTRVTGDLREATVFYTVYGDDEERAAEEIVRCVDACLAASLAAFWATRLRARGRCLLHRAVGECALAGRECLDRTGAGRRSLGLLRLLVPVAIALRHVTDPVSLYAARGRGFTSGRGQARPDCASHRIGSGSTRMRAC